MTFIPKVKTIIGGEVPGKLIDQKTGRQYLGEFIQDYKGNFYKGTSITRDSEQLLLQTEEKESKEIKGLRFIYRKPSQKDYTNGTFKRYFVKDLTIGKVIEVDRKKYVEYRKMKKPYYITYELNWYIVGNKEDYYINNVKTPGIKTLNIKTTQEGDKILPGLSSQVLKDPLEFVI